MDEDGLYVRIISMGNLMIAWRKARENKTMHPDVVEFERDLIKNLLDLHNELRTGVYKPRPLVTFVLRDPKTRVISKSDFRDRVVHHTLINVIGVIFEKSFIYDSCANQIGKGTSFALQRFRKYMKKVSNPVTQSGFCLKADIYHYFQEIDHEVLLSIIKRKISDENVLSLIKNILDNLPKQIGGGANARRACLSEI